MPVRQGLWVPAAPRDRKVHGQPLSRGPDMVLTLRTGFTPPGINGEARHNGWHQDELTSVPEIEPALERLAAATSAAGFPDRDFFAVRLAVEEALVNSIKHGHQHDPRK